jgi:putative NADH-flavin reductase
MKIVVFGATGGTGSELVAQALAQGHVVTALARRPDALGARPDISVVAGDVTDPRSVERAIAGQEAVLWAVGGHDAVRSALSGRRRRDTAISGVRDQDGVCALGTRHVLASMGEHGVHRLVAITSWGVGDSRQRLPLFFRAVIFPLIMQQVVADKERQEALIRQSAVDWTIVRPARLTDGPWTGTYRAGNALRFPANASISRADVADFVLRQLADARFLRQSVELNA